MKKCLSLTVKYALLLFLLLLSASAVYPQDAAETPTLTLTNPLVSYEGADPWLTYYDGNYYLATTTGASLLTMRKAPSLEGLKTATPLTIYYETEPSRCCNMWAPEFRLFEGDDGQQHWYFYYTAGTSGTLDNQHSHVLESEGTDPLGPYHYKARLFDPAQDTWSIDGSVMVLDGAMYFLNSVWVGDYQELFIAPMSNPWTISGSRVMISRSDYAWEKSGLNVNEGPVALQHDDQTFIIYSASYCATADYKLGMLTYTGSEPLSAASWVKNPEPVFQRSDANGVYGPGHNGFFTSPDGTEDWIVYHANSGPNEGCGSSRTTRVQKFTWNADGTPNFGVPVALGEEIAAPSGDSGIVTPPQTVATTRFKLADADGYLRHQNLSFSVSFSVTPVEDSQFVVVPGLADPAAMSIQSVNFPGLYLRHDEFELDHARLE